MRHIDWMRAGLSRTVVLRLAVLTAVCLPATTADAQAYQYNTGYNWVNMPGSACRPERFSNEVNDVYHDTGMTSVRSGRGPRRLLCPIPRRGVRYYTSNSFGTKVNMGTTELRGIDSSSTHQFVCSSFITDWLSQSTTWGAPRHLCFSALGCSSQSASYTGANSMRIAPPANGSSIFTVNFGIVCDIGSSSSIEYYEVPVTPH